jgi:two-component system chemotaxis response regulator CheY
MARILIVDDSTVIRKVMRQILEDLGHKVDEAQDGAIALAHLVDGPVVNAVVCDIDMPVMDGLTFVSSLRGMEWVAQPPVVMCSTHNAFERIGDALNRGANEYVMKPFSPEIIAEKLAAIGVA